MKINLTKQYYKYTVIKRLITWYISIWIRSPGKITTWDGSSLKFAMTDSSACVVGSSNVDNFTET